MKGVRPVATATLVAVAFLAVGVVAFAPTVAAQDAGTYTVEQGEECIDVDAVGDGSRTVEEFYDYRTPYTEPESDTYSSFGTSDFQEDNTSHLLIYEGADGTSVVVIHEELHEPASEGSYGGTAEMTFTDLPGDSEWAVEDDDYPDQEDDTFEDDGTTLTAEWYYAEGRTDGGAIRGVDDGSSFTVDATFNEGTWGGTYDGVINDWVVVTGEGDDDRESLAMDQPATIAPGTCGEGDPGDPAVDLDAPESAAVGETVTLDASDSETTGDATYEWYVDGDRVEDADGPTHETTFEETGEHDVRVEVTDDVGDGSAEASVDVYDGPNAAFEVRPSSAEAGDRVTFDANETDGDVDEYAWEFGDGESAAGELATHTYEEPGTYDVVLTVTGDSGVEDTATGTVEISEPVGPDAVLEAPESATTGETVTLDAGDSETTGETTYEWYVNEERVEDADGPTLETTFEEAGDHPVRVHVTDAEGDDAAGETIAVEGRLSASATANPTTVETGESVTFDGADSAGDVASYEWDFEDGSEATGEVVSHDFEEAGTYQAELTVRNDAGEADTDAVEITVEETAGSGGGSGDGTSVEMDDGTAVIEPGTVEAGEPVSIDISSAGADDPAVRVDAIELVPAEDAADPTVQLETVDRAVPGRFAPRSAYVLMSPVDLESVTYEFAVDPELKAGSGVAESDLVAYTEAGDGWDALETETDWEGDRFTAVATVDGDAPVGVGTDGPALLVTDVESDGVVTDSTLDLVATVRNTGTEAADANLTFAGGDGSAEVPVELAAGEETDVEGSVAVDDPEDPDVRVGGVRPDLQVVTATDLSVDEESIDPGESITVETELRNHGDVDGEQEVALYVAGSVVDSQTVELDAGEETTVTFEQRIESDGTYEVAVGDQRRTVEVGDGDDGDGAIEEATQDGAGFGPLAALLAGLATVLGARLRAD